VLKEESEKESEKAEAAVVPVNSPNASKMIQEVQKRGLNTRNPEQIVENKTAVKQVVQDKNFQPNQTV